MATRSEPTIMEKMFTRFIIKEELNEIGIFKRGKCILNHINKLEEKLTELQLNETEKATALLKSLDENCRLELQSILDFRHDYKYLSKKCRELFADKISEVSAYVDLLNLHQGKCQSLKEFVSDIRIKAMNVLPKDIDPQERERYMILTFTQGIQNRNCAVVIKEMNPRSLEEAYTMIKHENSMKEESEQLLYKISETSELEERLDKALKTIKALEKRISQLENSNKKNNPRENIVCYNCGGYNHISRNCPKKIKCQFCGVSGHTESQCWKKQKNPRNLRNIEIKSDTDSVKTEELLDADTISEGKLSQQMFQNSKKKSIYAFNRKSKKYPQEIENWNSYINGHGKRPKTVISNSNSEQAANKPVVHCSILKSTKSVFFDSGSEGNVVDKSYFESLLRSKKHKFIQKRSKLLCANGSTLDIVGYTLLNLKVGTKEIAAKFAVVDKIFPNIIVGLKTMKKENIAIIPRNDCLVIDGNDTVPFLSKTVLN